MNTYIKTPFVVLIMALALCAIISCSAVKTPVSNQYTLSAFSNQHFNRHPSPISILVNKPEATAGYDTEQMLYQIKPYELSSFAHNAWIDPPADMLFPLMVQSLQASGHFFAVASIPGTETADYQLNTQLIELQQNFLRKPSVLEFTAKIVLTKGPNYHLVASRIIKIQVPCPSNTPYGGVVAANQATRQFTAIATQFVIDHL